MTVDLALPNFYAILGFLVPYFDRLVSLPATPPCS